MHDAGGEGRRGWKRKVAESVLRASPTSRHAGHIDIRDLVALNKIIAKLFVHT